MPRNNWLKLPQWLILRGDLYLKLIMEEAISERHARSAQLTMTEYLLLLNKLAEMRAASILSEPFFEVPEPRFSYSLHASTNEQPCELHDIWLLPAEHDALEEYLTLVRFASVQQGATVNA